MNLQLVVFRKTLRNYLLTSSSCLGSLTCLENEIDIIPLWLVSLPQAKSISATTKLVSRDIRQKQDDWSHTHPTREPPHISIQLQSWTPMWQTQPISHRQICTPTYLYTDGTSQNRMTSMWKTNTSTPKYQARWNIGPLCLVSAMNPTEFTQRMKADAMCSLLEGYCQIRPPSWGGWDWLLMGRW